MEFFRDTDIQFMRHRYRWLILSAAFVLLSVFAVFVRGHLNLGIDFTGGTELTLKFRSELEIQRLREIVAAAGFGDAQIQSFGDTENGEVLIKAPTVAAFLTLVGYSVNDSVVVFDRVRENLRQRRSRSFEETINLSLNQTLSRTAITSGSTLLAVGSLLALGGDVLRGFAFILTVGVIVGTYSSIFVASPFALLWEQRFGREARSRRKESKVPRRTAFD